MTRSQLLSIVIAAAGLTGCENPFASSVSEPVGVCTRELRVKLSPLDPTIQVGETLKPDLELSSCGGSEKLTASWHLAAESDDVVHIGPDRRSLVGLRTGAAIVDVHDAYYGRVGMIRVSVVSAQ